MSPERRISQRMQNLEPSPTRGVGAKVKEMKRSGIPVIEFNRGEPEFTTPEHILRALHKAIDDGHTHYTETAGIPELREAAAKKLERDNGLIYSPSEITFSTGAKQSLYNAIQALCDPGDEVLITTPTWSTYLEQVKLAGGIPVEVPLKPPYEPSAEDLEPYIRDSTRIIILNSPSNPAGAVLDETGFREFADLVVSKGLWIITDEIYERLVYEGEHISIASLGDDIKDSTITINGLSKGSAATGLRVGFAAGPRDIIKAMTDFQGQVSSNITSIVQYGAIEALIGDLSEEEENKRKYQARRDLVIKGLNEIPGLQFTIPHGAFYVFVSLKDILRDGQSSENWCEQLLVKYEVATVQGEAFASPGNFRLGYAVEDEVLDEGLGRIKESVEAT